MNSVILIANTRGQITIPKKIRDKLRITSQTPLIASLKDNAIIIEIYSKNRKR